MFVLSQCQHCLLWVIVSILCTKSMSAMFVHKSKLLHMALRKVCLDKSDVWSKMNKIARKHMKMIQIAKWSHNFYNTQKTGNDLAREFMSVTIGILIIPCNLCIWMKSLWNKNHVYLLSISLTCPSRPLNLPRSF